MLDAGCRAPAAGMSCLPVKTRDVGPVTGQRGGRAWGETSLCRERKKMIYSLEFRP